MTLAQSLHPLVIKRDGSQVAFDWQRIQNAIEQAMQAERVVDPTFAIQITGAVCAQLDTQAEVAIADIQQAVEDQLMASKYKQVARAYIQYRHDRDISREKQSRLTQAILGLIEQSNTDLLHENANKDSRVIPTQRDLLAGIVAKHYACHHLLPAEVVQAHQQGDLHYHDLDYSPFFPMFNCMLIDLEGMLRLGFKMGNAEIDQPKSIATATAVTAQIIAQVASHIYGGTTIDRIDEVLAPYVEKSYQKHLARAQQWQIQQATDYAWSCTEKECLDAFQSLEYEVNTLHTANGQTPFVTFGFGLGACRAAKLIQRAILQTRIDGLGINRRTAIFPKLVLALQEGHNLRSQDPNYDIKQLALRCASERMYPDILSVPKVIEATGSFKTPMGCRSFLNAWQDEQGKEVHAGRNNLGVVSVNLPAVALKAKGDLDCFWQLLAQSLAVAKQALMTRIERLRGVKAKVAPILYMEGACGIRLQAEDDILQLFVNGRASISLGYIGLHEMLVALFGQEQHPYDDPAQQAFALQVVQHLRDQVEQWKQDTGFGFSLYATPSENLCHRFCALDSKRFGLVPGVTDRGYYTNSFHLDVQKKVSPWDKIDFEARFPFISSGGHICYGEFPNMQHNLAALESVWDYAYQRVPYYGTNTPIDECYDCGYKGEFDCTSKGFCCPECGNHEPSRVSVTRRVCGYLGSPDSRPFNAGKQAEVQRRVKHL